MNAVITVTGRDCMGIVAKVSGKCYEYGANIVDVSQSVMREYFAMMMLVELGSLTVDFGEFVDILKKLGDENGLTIHTMHEDIFNSMHRI